MLRLAFDRGTLLLEGDLPAGLALPGFTADRRVGCRRSPACRYRETLTKSATTELTT
jgi:Xeroderma pigmentosum group B helicase damage recognition domain